MLCADFFGGLSCLVDERAEASNPASRNGVTRVRQEAEGLGDALWLSATRDQVSARYAGYARYATLLAGAMSGDVGEATMTLPRAGTGRAALEEIRTFRDA